MLLKSGKEGVNKEENLLVKERRKVSTNMTSNP